MKVVIAGGGTAGHVNPALALARSLPEAEVIFLGTDRGAEARLVPDSGFELRKIEVRGFDRSRPLSLFGTGAKAVGAVLQARRLLSDIAPQVVVGMGGYVSLPACLAAKAQRRPIVIHEQNVVFGLANKVCRPLAHAVAVSFEETLEEAGTKGVFTGNPVLPELALLDLVAARKSGLARWDLDPDKRTLLVFGGSQGARTINDSAAGLAGLWDGRDDVQILHVTGRSSYGTIKERVDTAAGSLIYRVVDYVSPMGEAYAVADLALCRGGATTVAELGVVGLPSIIVPYPHHRDMQQERHGLALAREGAAIVVSDEEATSARIANEADRILKDPDALGKMKVATRRLGRPDAAERLAAVVREAAR